MEGLEAVRCRACGDPLPDRARNCPTCGTAVDERPEPEPAAWPGGPLAEAAQSAPTAGDGDDLPPLPPPPPVGAQLDRLGEPVDEPEPDEYEPPSM